MGIAIEKELTKNTLHELTGALTALHRGQKVYWPAMNLLADFDTSRPIKGHWSGDKVYTKLARQQGKDWELSVESAIDVADRRVEEIEAMLAEYQEVRAAVFHELELEG